MSNDFAATAPFLFPEEPAHDAPHLPAHANEHAAQELPKIAKQAVAEPVAPAKPRPVAFKGSRADKKIQAALVTALDGAPYARTVTKSRKSLLSVASGVTFAMISPIPTAPGVAMMMVAQGLKTPNVEMKFEVDLQHKGLMSLLPKLEVKLEEPERIAGHNPANPENEHHKQPANLLSTRGQTRTSRSIYGKNAMNSTKTFIPDPESESFAERLKKQADTVKRGLV